MKITLFGTQPYDRESFDRIRDTYGFDICYHRSHLNANNVALAQGSDAVCIFVNDTADAGTIRQLAGMGVKLIALRCAGFNNVDLNAAARYGIPVVRVPAYSPHAVAEHAVALMLALNRKIHRAYWAHARRQLLAPRADGLRHVRQDRGDRRARAGSPAS